MTIPRAAPLSQTGLPTAGSFRKGPSSGPGAGLSDACSLGRGCAFVRTLRTYDNTFTDKRWFLSACCRIPRPYHIFVSSWN
jgi:hypothetical protein